LSKLTVPETDGTWTQIFGKDDLKDHLIQRNVEQFSLAGETPFGYSPLGKELGHNRYSEMADKIHEGTLEHAALSDASINAVVKQLMKHPALDKVSKPAVTKDDFKSAFNCVRGKQRRLIPGEEWNTTRHAPRVLMMGLWIFIYSSQSNDVGAFRFWVLSIEMENAVDVMLEKIPGVSRSDKLRIIQLLEADLNQVLKIVFARNIGRSAKNMKGLFQSTNMDGLTKHARLLCSTSY
jgi:hypothetical protein